MAKRKKRVPNYCYRCSAVGHRDENCPRNIETPTTSSMSDRITACVPPASVNSLPATGVVEHPGVVEVSSESVLGPNLVHSIVRSDPSDNATDSHEVVSDLSLTSHSNADSSLARHSEPVVRTSKRLALRAMHCGTHLQRVCCRCGQTGHYSGTCLKRKSITNSTATDVPNSSVSAQTEAVTVTENDIDVENNLKHLCGNCNKSGHVSLMCNKSRSSINSDVNVTSELDDVLQCAHCHRAETACYALNLQPLSANFKTRKFGDGKNVREGSLVCSCCVQYLNSTVKKPKWSYAWPSTVFTFLTSPPDDCDVESFVKMLPATIRYSYRILVPMLSPRIASFWHVEPSFIDATNDLKYLKRQLGKYKIATMTASLNATAFPTCVCPQGCLIYVDNASDIRLLPACHYLQTFCQSFSSYNSDQRYFDGARKDWPYVKPIANKWLTGATLIADEQLGLCVVQCSTKKHADGRTKYIHVPRNPILGNESQLAPDAVAPATVKPNFVRSGRSNAKNSCSPVLKERGGSLGASSFSLTPGPCRGRLYSRKEIRSMGFTLKNRPDVHQSCVDAEILDQTFYQDCIESYENEKLTDDQILRAKETGTFVDCSDSINLLQNLSERHAERDEVNASSSEDLGILQICHPADSAGSPPTRVPYFGIKENPVKSGIALHSVIHSLMHSRYLWNSFHERSKSVPDNALHKAVQSLLSQVGQHKEPKNVLNLEKQLIRHVIELGLVAVDADPTLQATAILEDLCQVKTINLRHNFRNLQKAHSAESKILLVNARNVKCKDAQVPMSLGNGRWFLSYASRQSLDRWNKYVFDVDYRWTSDSHFHHCDGPHSKSSNSIRNLNWDMLIYVEDKDLAIMSKKDYINFSGGQSKLRCSFHDRKFMMKYVAPKPPLAALTCCYPDCSSPLHWICSHAFGCTVRSPCTTGVCRKHGDYIFKSDTESGVVQHRSLEGRRAVPSDVPLTLPDEEHNVEQVRELEHLLDPPDYRRFTHEEDARPDIDLQDPDDIFIDMLDVNLPSFTAFAPISSTDTKRSPTTLGHYLLNQHLSVFSRVNFNRKSPVSFQRFFQHLHSIGNEKNLPLLYPEGLLFPQIFYATVRDSVVGALPSVMFTGYGRRSVFGGFATLVDHLRVRLSDNESLTSHDPSYIAFAFDVYLNSLLQSNSVLIAMNKGLEHINKAFVQPEDRQNGFRFDEVDSRKHVKRLSAMMRDHPWTYFITLTCNDSSTFGVGPIRAALEELHGADTPALDRELQNYAPILCRAWERSVRYFFDYLEHSQEQMFGKLRSFWYRYEFQSEGAVGNRPHVHGGLTLDPDTLNEKMDLDRVHNRICDLFSARHGTDYDTLFDDGFVANRHEYAELYELGDSLTRHRCENSKTRCQKLRADGTYSCRVPRHDGHYPAYFKEKRNLFDADTTERLFNLGLGTKVLNPFPKKVPTYDIKLNPEFRGGRYIYPTDPECIRSPSNGRLFVAFRSMVNVQLCDRRFQVSYLAKYAAGANEQREAFIKSRLNNPNDIKVTMQGLYHSKISGAKMAHDAQNKRDGAPEALAREISLTEMIWFLLGLPYVCTNIVFQNFSTHPPENRSAVVKRNAKCNRKFLGADDAFLPVKLRENLPEWRQFTNSQLILIRENSASMIAVDSTSSFSLRPPELRFIRTPVQYLQFFTGASVSCYQALPDLLTNPWIDGSCRKMKVRLRYLDSVTRHLEQLANESENDGLREMLNLFQNLSSEARLGNRVKSDMFKNFVDYSCTKEVVVVPTTIEPKCQNKFLVHLLLSQGKFDTEIDLFAHPSLMHSFAAAGLIEDVNHPTEREAISIARRYVEEQLRVLPLSAASLGRCLKLAMDGLQHFFRTNSIDYGDVPLASLRAIKIHAEEKLQALEKSNRDRFLTALLNYNFENAPEFDLASNAPTFEFIPTLTVDFLGQSRSSKAEQRLCLELLKSAIQSFSNIGSSFVKFPLLCGPPGAGKTHLLMMAALFCLSKGLHTIATAITAERAQVLGGEHLHMLFCLPVSQSKLQSVTTIVENCLGNLVRNPVKLAYLKRLDVLIIEELGLVPGYLFNVLDVVMRRIKDCSYPFGGVLILASGDPKQLKPIQGRPIWLSTNLYTCFQVMCLKHFVRSRSDPDLQEIIAVMRKPKVTADESRSVISKLSERCFPQNCVASWQLVPDQYHRVVGKNAAVSHAVNVFLTQKRETPGLVYCTVKAEDEVNTMGNNFVPANAKISDRLSRHVKEPQELLLYVGQKVRLTFNHTRATKNIPRFSQGQLAVVTHLPDTNLQLNEQRVELRLLPPGCRNCDLQSIPATSRPFKLAPRATIPVIVGFQMTKARRIQFPLAYYVCSTVHRLLGETCSKLATQITFDKKDMFSLWDRQQLLVIISRVSSLDDILFVGSRQETLQAVKQLLGQTEDFDEHIDKVMSSIDVLRDGGGILPPTNLLPSLNTSIPSRDSGFVFMLVSIKYPQLFKLEEDQSLEKMLRKYNTSDERGIGPNRPWAVACFTCGFPEAGCHYDNKRMRLLFLHKWIHAIYLRHRSSSNSSSAMICGEQAFIEFRQNNADAGQLVFKKCCILPDPLLPNHSSQQIVGAGIAVSGPSNVSVINPPKRRLTDERPETNVSRKKRKF